MIHRLINHNADAIALQNAAELRRSQSAAAPATKFNIAEILGGADWEETAGAVKASSVTKGSQVGFSDAIATATTPVVQGDPGSREPVTAPTTAPTQTTASSPTTVETTTTPMPTGEPTTTAETAGAAAATTPAATPAVTVTTPGVGALVTAIMNGSFQPTYVTNPAQLQETTYTGTATMPNFYYASDQTATQLASLLGGKVVQLPPFGQGGGASEPDANFIQLPNGQTFNAADVAYYATSGSEGGAQLTADITATINQGSAWTNYYQQGGSMPIFQMGYVGPPISGMTYPAGMIGADGNVINPSMTQSATAAA
jgi:hypothetical protein